MFLLLFAGCSDYGFGDEAEHATPDPSSWGATTDHDGDGIEDGFDPDDDNDGIPDSEDPDDDGDGVPDTEDPDGNDDDTDDDDDGIPDEDDPDDDGDGTPDVDDPDDDEDGTPDEYEDDPCWEPDAALDKHPAAGLVVTQDDIGFDLIFVGSDAGYTNELWLWDPAKVYVATGHATAPGTLVSVGSFAVGTELVFAIVVTDNGNTWYSGPATRNADSFDHAAITYVGDCEWVVGFEDEDGGGDQDFNDIELTIAGPLEMQLVP